MLSGSVEKVSFIKYPTLSPSSSSANNLREQLASERSSTPCVICMEQDVSHMAIPCNHAAFCASDATAQMAKSERICPICRNPVTSFMKIFLSWRLSISFLLKPHSSFPGMLMPTDDYSCNFHSFLHWCSSGFCSSGKSKYCMYTLPFKHTNYIAIPNEKVLQY